MISILAKKLLQDITKCGPDRVSSLSLVPRSENMAAAIRRVNSMQYDVYTQTEVSNGKPSRRFRQFCRRPRKSIRSR
ncbi:hypothetical protein BON83_06535 [Escherichia coli]|nr:hypothetical protein BSZ13_08755 [Escherichia coli]AQV51882.1 hypothetical protein BE949_11930 [Escherichia coli]OKT72278.1 hypothetical protein ACN71_05285 [Escherichia coli]ONF87676.1 hypothetical protein BZL66_06870 [Escherichia coli]ONG21839.1 hypothetical protein BXT95_13465 [Escherichia coli]